MFYTMEPITPENEEKAKVFFGDLWFKKINAWWKSVFQQMDNVYTNKGKEALDTDEFFGGDVKKAQAEIERQRKAK